MEAERDGFAGVVNLAGQRLPGFTLSLVIVGLRRHLTSVERREFNRQGPHPFGHQSLSHHLIGALHGNERLPWPRESCTSRITTPRCRWLVSALQGIGSSLSGTCC